MVRMGYWSEASLRDYEPSDAATCKEHLLDQSLIERLNSHFTETECTYCGAAAPQIAVPLDELLAIGMEKVRSEFSPAEDYGSSLGDLGISYERDWDTKDALYEVYEGAVADEVLETLTSCANDAGWVPDNLLYLDEQQRMMATWEAFVKTVRHGRRFWFSQPTNPTWGLDPETLSVANFFDRIADLLTRADIAVPLPVGSELVRGRMVHAEKAVKDFDGKALGAPPVERAAANRMSPAGISMFYGGDSPGTVVAEIGAHSTYNHAVYGTFTTLRPLSLIDLTHLPPAPGYFAHGDDRLLLIFLKDFVGDLVKPIILDGREHIDYVPTQIVTEFLRHFTKPQVHGLRFASSQHPGGINTVLFCDRDKCVNPPDSVLDQEGWPAAEIRDEVAAKFPDQMPWLQFDPASVAKVRTQVTIPGP